MDEKSDKKEKGEEKDTEDNQNQGIVGIQNTQEHWPDLASATRIRPSLPRRSKAMHRVVPEIPGISRLIRILECSETRSG